MWAHKNERERKLRHVCMTDDVGVGGEEKFDKTRLDDSRVETFGQVNAWNPMLCQHTLVKLVTFFLPRTIQHYIC